MTDFSSVDEYARYGLEKHYYTALCLAAGVGERLLLRIACGRLHPDEDAAPCTLQTRFDLASLTKPMVVATLCHRAQEEGLLDLNEPLSALCAAPRDKAAITPLQILTHTAGFGAGLELWRGAANREAFLQRIWDAPLAYAPGKQVLYSDYGFILLGTLLEKLYGERLNALAQEKIFHPLGMKDTSYLPMGENIAATERQADGSCLTGIVHDPSARLLGGVSGNAGVFSTAEDTARYVQMLYHRGKLPDGSQLLSEKSVELMTANLTPGMEKARSAGLYLPRYDHGFIGDCFPMETVAHTGFTGTSFALDPGSGIFLVLMTNRVCPGRENNAMPEFRRKMHSEVWKACRGE